jgi:hypothetical protein
VLGLTLGSLLGIMSPVYLFFVILMIIVIVVLIFKKGIPAYQAASRDEQLLDTHDLIMMGILLIMCFRSFIFDVMNSAAFHFENGVLVFGISAFLGKIIGGTLADKIGWKKFIYITLPLAFILFQFGKENLYAMAFGIACRQSSVPLTLLLISRSLPLFPATATALSLGTSVALAGLPLYIGKTNTGSNPPSLSWLWVFIAMMVAWVAVSLIKRRFTAVKSVLTST